jgi:hypothetical protein
MFHFDFRMTMIEMIKLVAGSGLALSLAWLWNQCLFISGISQRLRLGFWIPAGEELIKWGILNCLHVSPPLFYGLFGLGEGLFESLAAPCKKITIILASMFTHTIFSLFYLTALPTYVQLFLAIGAHMIWNGTILFWNQID